MIEIHILDDAEVLPKKEELGLEVVSVKKKPEEEALLPEEAPSTEPVAAPERVKPKSELEELEDQLKEIEGQLQDIK